MQTIDVVVTDLDGTFWDAHTEVHPTTIAAVAELDRRGIELIYATGRRLHAAHRVFEALAAQGFDLWRPTIVLNGTLAADLPNLEPFHVSTFSPDAAHEVVRAFDDCGHVPCAYTSDGRVHVSESATTGPLHRAGFGDDTETGEPGVIGATGDVVGFSVIGVELDGLEGLAPSLREFGMLVDHYQDPVFGGWSVMAQPPGVSKWSGVEACLARAGRTDAAVLAVGDGGNDVEMVRNAAVGLAVAGGDPAVLEVADGLIGVPSDGGWAAVLDHLG